MIEVKAPNPTPVDRRSSIFLAGSIEMGSAENWQERVVRELEEYQGVIFNPRRDDWDSSWKQEASNPQFLEQVNWELHHLFTANHVLFYFSPETKSPVTLLELGMCLNDKALIVVCPEGYWRRGNIQITCGVHNVPVLDSLEEGINKLKSILKKKSYV